MIVTKLKRMSEDLNRLQIFLKDIDKDLWKAFEKTQNTSNISNRINEAEKRVEKIKKEIYDF